VPAIVYESNTPFAGGEISQFVDYLRAPDAGSTPTNDNGLTPPNTETGGNRYQSGTPAIGDHIAWTVSTSAATYRLFIFMRCEADAAKIQVSVDGTNVGSEIDTFAQSGAEKAAVFGGFGDLELGAGAHIVKLTVTGKNASSTAYYFNPGGFALVPTS